MRITCIALAQPQQTMIDEHAHQLSADGAVQERRDDGRIDAAGQAQQHLAVADLSAHALDGVLDDVADAPQRLAAADLAHETLEQLRALTRVRHLGMELHAVEAAPLISHGRERRSHPWTPWRLNPSGSSSTRSP